MNEPVFWIAFNAFIILMLALDLGIFQRKDRVITLKESMRWIALWIFLAMAFNAFVYYWKGSEKALEFLTGYVIELSLSVDNLFVFIMIFSYFHVPKKYEHKVLFWGILGALIMRAIFIFAGVALISKFHWVIYIFGAFLVYTGIKMAFDSGVKIEVEKNPVVRLFRRIIPVHGEYDGNKFITKINGKSFATPLMIVLIMIETTDLIFAVDSIPAVLAISQDPFIVYTSNIFAILGLRSIYFALSGMLHIFRFLKYGLAVILTFVGIKMLLSDIVQIETALSLAIVVSILAISMMVSLIWKEKQ